MIIDSFSGAHRFLSNFYASPINLFGWDFLTVEHAYQACKTNNIEWSYRIQQAATPGEAKRLGRKVPIRENWEEVKDQTMLDCLRAKFATPSLRLKLLATGDATLVEGNTWGDRYWGMCGGVGQNKLGQLLMQVREECK